MDIKGKENRSRRQDEDCARQNQEFMTNYDVEEGRYDVGGRSDSTSKRNLKTQPQLFKNNLICKHLEAKHIIKRRI